MNRYSTSHPDTECLLQYADGELSNGNAAEVRTHLEACWNCRAEIEGLQATITDYVRYQQAVFDSPPEPPASWDTFEARLDRLIANRQKRPARRWFVPAFALAAVAAACLVVVRLNHPSAVSAAELLRKASEKEAATTHRPHRLRIRDSANRGEAELRSLFVEAHYNWDDALSATAFRAWRDSLAHPQDDVALESGVYRIRTDADAGSLQEAILNLRADDLGVVSGSFRFRSQELVEVSVLPDEAVPSVERSAPGPSRAPAPAAPPSAGPAEELHVLAALHDAGADQGEQIDLSRDQAGHFVVTATGLAPERRAAIEGSLSSLPEVILRFPQPTIDLSKPTQGAGSQSQTAAAEPGPIQRQLQAALGGASELSNFTGQIFELSEAAMVQAHGLRNLATRFSAEVEARLDAKDHATLARLRRDHLQALAEKAAGLEHLLTPVLASLGAPASQLTDQRPTAANWQSATEALFASTQRFDRMATTLLTGGTTVPETGRAMQQLRSDLDWYGRY